MTALSLVWPSPATVWKSLSFSPVFFRNSGQIWVMESAGVIATVLPLMSSGFLMFLFRRNPSPTSGWSAAARRWPQSARPSPRAHHGGHVDIAEIGGLGRHCLRGCPPSRGLPGFRGRCRRRHRCLWPCRNRTARARHRRTSSASAQPCRRRMREPPPARSRSMRPRPLSVFRIIVVLPTSVFRHCERSEAIHSFLMALWIASLRSQ